MSIFTEKNNILSRLILTILIAISFVVLLQRKINIQETIPSDNLFISEFAPNTNLNKGIKITAPILSFQISEGSYFVFQVTNYANENIIFENEYLGLRIFRFENMKNEWVEVTPHVIPERMELVLESVVFKDDIIPYVENVLVREFDYEILETDEWLRFLVSGNGESSGNDYGAYIDIQIEFP